MDKIPNNYRSERVRAGLNRDQLAEELNKIVNVVRPRASAEAVRGWEDGESYPRSDYLQAMADLFGCSTDYLLARTEERLPHRPVEVRVIPNYVTSARGMGLAGAEASVYTALVGGAHTQAALMQASCVSGLTLQRTLDSLQAKTFALLESGDDTTAPQWRHNAQADRLARIACGYDVTQEDLLG